jgi:hypothetical protein
MAELEAAFPSAEDDVDEEGDFHPKGRPPKSRAKKESKRREKPQ